MYAHREMTATITLHLAWNGDDEDWPDAEKLEELLVGEGFRFEMLRGNLCVDLEDVEIEYLEDYKQ